jgi:hypothetical protein
VSWYSPLLRLVGAQPLDPADDGRARRLQIAATAGLASAGLCALYGFAVGLGDDLGLAAQNLYKLPMVVLLGTGFALPVGLVVWKLTGTAGRASDLVLGAAAGTLAGSVILAVLAPLVALYYATSSWLGPVLAIGAAVVATAVGMFVAVRSIGRAPLPDEPDRRGPGRLPPVVALATVHLLSVSQLIALASPILSEQTVFDGGMDALLGE